MNETRKSVESKHSSAVSPESTYSQIGSRGEAWKSPIAGWPSPAGSSASRNSRVVSGDHLLRPARGQRRAAREVLEREHLDDREVVVARQARSSSARRPARRRRRARRRSRRGRRGTTAPPRRPSRQRRSPPRRRGGSRGCRCRWRPAWRSVYSVPHRLRLPAALVAALVVAEAAVLLLRPKERYPVVQAEARAYFSAAELGARHGFPRAASCGSTARAPRSSWACWSPPSRLAPPSGRRPVADRRRGRRRRSRSPRTAAALPLRAASRQRAKDVGLVTQSLGRLGGRRRQGRRRSAACFAAARRRAAGRSACGASAATGGRRAPRRSPASRSSSPTSAPVVLDPMFNRFTPLPAGDDARRTCSTLARKAGVEVGEVYEVDASRRTTAANAYVTGLGRTKRVVLYDTLLKDFTPAETRLVVAHELGHVRHQRRPGRAAVARAGRARSGRSPSRAPPSGSRARARPPVPAVVLAPRARRPGADDDLQPALARDRAPRRRLRARPHAASPTRWSASSAGSRSRTSATPTRRAGSSSSRHAPAHDGADRPGAGGYSP